MCNDNKDNTTDNITTTTLGECLWNLTMSISVLHLG